MMGHQKMQNTSFTATGVRASDDGQAIAKKSKDTANIPWFVMLGAAVL
ncbi:hypothetical protein [Paenibacillus thalictri]|nr:hypothetical protein [Paenibacillus thalictri]